MKPSASNKKKVPPKAHTSVPLSSSSSSAGAGATTKATTTTSSSLTKRTLGGIKKKLISLDDSELLRAAEAREREDRLLLKQQQLQQQVQQQQPPQNTSVVAPSTTVAPSPAQQQQQQQQNVRRSSSFAVTPSPTPAAPQNQQQHLLSVTAASASATTPSPFVTSFRRCVSNDAKHSSASEVAKEMNDQLKQQLHHAGAAVSFLAPRLSQFHGNEDEKNKSKNKRGGGGGAFRNDSNDSSSSSGGDDFFLSDEEEDYYDDENSFLKNHQTPTQSPIRKRKQQDNNNTNEGEDEERQRQQDPSYSPSPSSGKYNYHVTDDSTWQRLSALPKHIQERVAPVWRHRTGISSLKKGEDISVLRPFDRLRVLRRDPYLRRDFRQRVAQEDRERKAIFNAQMTERLDRQRESDISVACAAVARQTDKLTHDEDEGRGPGFSALTNRKLAAPSGRVIRQYFEYATREMKIWRRAQRLSTVEERGKQLQNSRDLRFEEELMQTEKALETRAGETELEIRQNFFITAITIAAAMIEWHGRVLEVLNPKSRSIRVVAIRAQIAVHKEVENRRMMMQEHGGTGGGVAGGEEYSSQQQQQQQQRQQQQQQQLQQIWDRYPRWSGSREIPANVCMFTRTANRKRQAARKIIRSWLFYRENYFEAKRHRSSSIIQHFMRDMGKVLSFTVACRRFKKVVHFVQHHWHGRSAKREARKELLVLQLQSLAEKDIEQAKKDIERFQFTIKQQEKEAQSRRGLSKLTGAESAHKILHNMTLQVQENTEYIERLQQFRESEVEEVAWKWVLRIVAEYDHKLVRYVHAFARYRKEAQIPHGTYTFITDSSNAGVKPTRPFFRRLLPEEDVRHILKQICGAAGEKATSPQEQLKQSVSMSVSPQASMAF